MLIIAPVAATVLLVAWLFLLGQVSREDWTTAAYNRVLDNRLEEDRLLMKDAARAGKLEQYHGIVARIMGLFLGGSSEKDC